MKYLKTKGFILFIIVVMPIFNISFANQDIGAVSKDSNQDNEIELKSSHPFLKANWKFENNYVDSVSSSQLTAFGSGIYFSQGKRDDYSIHFTRSSYTQGEYLKGGFNFTNEHISRSIAVWFRMDEDNPDGGHIFSLGAANYYAGFMGLFVRSTEVCFNGNYNDLIANVSLETGKWYHVAYSYDTNRNVCIYLNSQLILEDQVAKNNTIETDDIAFGARWFSSKVESFFGGLIDDFCYYENYVFSQEEVNWLYQGQKPIPTYLEPISGPSTTGKIFLSWEPVWRATSYKVYRSTSFISSISGLQPIKTDIQNVSYLDLVATNGTYYYVVVVANDSGDSDISNCQNVSVELTEKMIINAEASLSYAFDALETDVIMNASYIKPTPHNNRVLDSWNIVPDEGYIRFFAYMAELKNIRACLTELGLPSCFINFLDLIISEDDSIRLLYNVNVLARESNKSFQDGILDLKSTFDFLMLFYTNPKDSKTIPELIKNNFKDPSVKNWFKITTGPKGNDILKLKEGIDPIDAVVSFINVFYRIDISLLTYRNGEVIPITIRSNELISSVQFIFNILKLVGKVAALAATGFTNPLGWVQTIATAYVIVHQLIFDPPWIVRTILNFIYTNLTEHINNIFAQFEGVASWVYVAANFLDPPAARFDLALYNQQGNMLLGYDKVSNSSVQNSSAGFVFGDQNAQFMVLYEDPGTKYDLKVTNTELEGEGQTELDYQLVVYQPNSTQSNIFEGYLDLGEETSTSIVLPEKGQQFTIPQLNISILKNEYPVFEIQILDENGNPVEVDSIKLYLANVELKFDYKYLGNGKYRLSNFALQENEQLIYQIVFIKAGYLMSSIHSSLFEAATNPVLVGILIGIAIVSLMAVVVVVKKTKRREKNKNLHRLLDQLK